MRVPEGLAIPAPKLKFVQDRKEALPPLLSWTTDASRIWAGCLDFPSVMFSHLSLPPVLLWIWSALAFRATVAQPPEPAISGAKGHERAHRCSLSCPVIKAKAANVGCPLCARVLTEPAYWSRICPPASPLLGLGDGVRGGTARWLSR